MVCDFFGAFFSAETTGDTFFSVDIAGALFEFDLKISCLTFNVNDVA